MIRKEDTYRHKGLRKELVEKLAAKGIEDAKVLAAVNKVPRHLFFRDSIFDKKAYEDHAFPIGEGQTISQPYTVAYQSQLLEIEPGMKVLEIGTGSGYQAAVLIEMGAVVYSIERQQKLYEHTRQLLPTIGYAKVKTYFGDGYAGLEVFAPYDRIIITAAAPEIPPKLLQQLAVGGKMVIPFGSGKSQKMMRLTKVDEKSFDQEIFDDFAFVPMLKGKAF